MQKHLGPVASLFFGIASKLPFPDHFFPNCCQLIVLYSTPCSGLAVLYLGYS